ncbi:hypothetical protein [uncultured Cohaesibacter sp.]|uniref:hypothetical protein n=1 Tax=uncultured Cohaesibacter sp. TaxID=1002546 RepID=UPI0029C788C6|nr:hypothetical protein [uncultured Cohaesibacter sp.]
MFDSRHSLSGRMSRPHLLTATLTLALVSLPLCALVPTAAQAGDRNILILEQKGSENTISVDQSNAFDSQVGGVALVPGDLLSETEFNILKFNEQPNAAADNPILQLGENNIADITIEGVGGAVFLQQGTDSGDVNNNATINLNGIGDSLAAILQAGSDNQAALTVFGNSTEGRILQLGDGNTAGLQVGADGLPANGGRATLTQEGSNNNTSVQVIGLTDGEYSYTVQGNGTTTSVPVTILTNGATVSVTQTQF